MPIELDKLSLDGNMDGDKLPTDILPKDNNEPKPEGNNPPPKVEDIKPEDTPKSEDGVIEFDLDKEGNVTINGEIVIKKEDVKKDADGNVIIPEDFDYQRDMILDVADSLSKEFGLEFKDAEGKPVAFTNDIKGITELVKTSAAHLQQQQEKDFFDAYPQLVGITRHLSTGQSLDSYFDYSSRWRKTEIPNETDKNKDTVKALRREIIIENEIATRTASLDAKTKTPERLAKIKKDAEDYSDYIFSRAQETEYSKSALDSLKEHELRQEANRDQRNNEILKAQEDANIKYWEDVATVVKTGKIGNIVIPEKEREAFHKYIAADANGKRQTQEMLDLQNAPIEMRLQLSYLMHKKFDLSELVKRQVRIENQKNLNDMKDANDKRQRYQMRGTTNNPKTNNGTGSEVNLDNLLKGNI